MVTAGQQRDVAPFTIDIPQDDLDDLDQRLRRTRFCRTSSTTTGPTVATATTTAGWWSTGVDEYDWRDMERRMNELPQFRVDLLGVPLHFVH